MTAANAKSNAADSVQRRALGDFTADRRLLMLAAMALVVGGGGAGAAWLLIRRDLLRIHASTSQAEGERKAYFKPGRRASEA